MDNTQRIEAALEAALAAQEGAEGPPRLAAAIRHAVFPGGARIRPHLTLAVAQGYKVRALTRRPQPARDDKVVTVWNALAITALAEAGIGLHRTEWVQRAAWCAGELLDRHIAVAVLRDG